MRDPISLERAKQLHPRVATEVIHLIDEIERDRFPKSIAVRIVQGLRTIEEQNALYAQGRTRPGPKVTNARGGSSYHNYGLAIDFALLYDKNGDGKYEELSWDIVKDLDKDGVKDWDEVVNTFKKAGWEFGGDWKTLKDYPHLQKSFGLTWQQLFEKYKNKDFVPGNKYVNLT